MFEIERLEKGQKIRSWLSSQARFGKNKDIELK